MKISRKDNPDGSYVVYVEFYHGSGVIAFHSKNKDWLGIDLDGTITRTDGKNHFEPPFPIGRIVPRMKKRILRLHNAGVRIKIFTARACEGEKEIAKVRRYLEEVKLPSFDVTNAKDYWMKACLDDRAFGMHENTGYIRGEKIPCHKMPKLRKFPSKAKKV